MLLNKKPPPMSGPAGCASASDAELAAEMPALHEYLTAVAYADGTKRDTSTVNVFTEEGRWKAALHDKDNRRSLYCTADTFSDALQGIDAMLAEGEAPWRAWKEENAATAARKAKKGLTKDQ